MLQLRTRCSIKRNVEHAADMLMFSFYLGPLEIFCLTHLPRPGEPDAVTYVKVSLKKRELVETETRTVDIWDLDSKGRTAELRTEFADFAFGPLIFRIEDDAIRVRLKERKLVETETQHVENWSASNGTHGER